MAAYQKIIYAVTVIELHRIMRQLLFLLFPTLLLGQTSFEEAVDLFDRQDFDQAREAFSEQLRRSPNNLKAIEYLGDIAGHAKDWDTAIEHYKELVETEPDNANYNFKYGGVLAMKALEVNKLRALSYIGDVKKYLHRAAELDPSHIEARWALVELYMQLPGIIGGSETRSFSYAEELGEISPVDGWLAKGYIAEYSDRPEQAEHYYKKAVEVGNSPHTYQKLTDHYEKHGKPKEAIETARISLNKHRRNSLNYQIGKIAAQYNIDPNYGIECLHAYIKNHSVRDGVPKDWAYYRLAQIYRNLGNKELALSWIDKALAQRPDFEQALSEKDQILDM